MEESSIEKKHSVGLIIFLILMIALNSFTTFTYFTNAEGFAEVLPKATSGLIYFLGMMTGLNVILAILVFLWKRLGVYGFYGVSATAFLINIYLGVAVVSALLGLVGAVLLYLLTRKRWQFFT